MVQTCMSNGTRKVNIYIYIYIRKNFIYHKKWPRKQLVAQIQLKNGVKRNMQEEN